jgi:hypothetical protein
MESFKRKERCLPETVRLGFIVVGHVNSDKPMTMIVIMANTAFNCPDVLLDIVDEHF